MKRKIEFFFLAAIGAVIAALAAYIQWFSMDVTHYQLTDYMRTDLRSSSWWGGIGAPFLVGAAYLVLAIYGIKAPLNYRQSFSLLLSCFIVGCVLAFASGLGYFAAVTTAVCLAVLVAKNRRAAA